MVGLVPFRDGSKSGPGEFVQRRKIDVVNEAIDLFQKSVSEDPKHNRGDVPRGEGKHHDVDTNESEPVEVDG